MPAPIPADFAAAKARHKDNLAHLQGIIQAGKTNTTGTYGQAWANACQWIDGGRTKLYAATLTHDASARATALGANGKVAYFGISEPMPTESDYNETDQRDSRNVETWASNILGYRRGGNPSQITIMEPKYAPASQLEQTIVHEVQHDADRHEGDEWGRYETEFRAYWMAGLEWANAATGTANATLTTSTAPSVTLTGFDNERQQMIFKHLYDDPAYAYVKEKWTNDASFRTKVLALKRPSGMNLVNSPRIDALYAEVSKSKPNVERVKNLARALNASDRSAIQSQGMQDQWRRLINNLDRDDRAEILGLVGLSGA
jgi:hypothetical protein